MYFLKELEVVEWQGVKRNMLPEKFGISDAHYIVTCADSPGPSHILSSLETLVILILLLQRRTF
jgi:hypothetical protein